MTGKKEAGMEAGEEAVEHDLDKIQADTMKGNAAHAGAYFAAGWLPIPMRVPGEQFRNKDGGVEVADGKRPAILWRGLADRDETPGDFALLLSYWNRRPEHGVALLLRPSGLLVIDADSYAAVQEVVDNTQETCHNVVKTRKGAHFYYRRPDHCPPLRTVQRGTSGKIDILADGFVVAPPSMHASGFQYQWHSAGSLQDAPDWAVGLLMAIRERSYVNAGVDPSSEQPRRLSANESMRLMAADERVYHYMSGQLKAEDRSRALWLSMNCLIRLGYDDATIANLIWFSALGEKPRSRGIGWLGDELARARLELTP